ncbi:MAG: molybdenum-binding transcriptional regulator, partial [Thermoanaerobaculia bacterium]|nr:molybdenum-binding transcriptional regulator [Thermoanaerobaculia bacterium]
MTRRAAAPLGAAVVKPRIRVMGGTEILLGPGKADLLEAVRDTGSLRQASAGLGMSYMRAWQLVKTMNGAFRD